jgi:Tol biopolymer transport system component
MPASRSTPLAAAMLVPLLGVSAQRPREYPTLARFDHTFESGPVASPNGRFLLVGQKNEIDLYDVARRTTTKLTGGESDGLVWSPSGAHIAWVRNGDGGNRQFAWTLALDPKTGAPRGQPQRVSVGAAESPAFSPDESLIAYSAPDTDAPGTSFFRLPHHVSIVPATGGPERVVAHCESAFFINGWSADGKNVFASCITKEGDELRKIPVDGGSTRVLHRGGMLFAMGMTANHLTFVLLPQKPRIAPGDQAVLLDTAGRETGRVPLPVGNYSINNAGIVGDSALVWTDVADQYRVEIRPLSGGEPTRVPLIGASNLAPAWSPDGKHIAFEVREGPRAAIAVVNADGSGVRVDRDAGFGYYKRWSPDSKSIVFASDDEHELRSLDATSHRTRTIVRDSASRIANVMWRDGGMSVALGSFKQASPRGMYIDEVTLAGVRTPLLDAASPGVSSQMNGWMYVNGSTIAYRTDSSYYVERFGAPPKRMASIPPTSLVMSARVSADESWIAGVLYDTKNPRRNQIELFSPRTGARRVLDMPFELAEVSPAFLPDGRSLLVVGEANSDRTHTVLYSVSLDGEAPRPVATIGLLPEFSALSVSPDGRSVTYAVREKQSLSLILVDLRPRP